MLCPSFTQSVMGSGSYLELFEEDGGAGPLHDGEQGLVGHEAHQAEGAGGHLLLLQETSSDLTLQLELVWITAQELYHQLRHPGTSWRVQSCSRRQEGTQ